MIRFSDGHNLDTSGEPRIARLPDGLYVLGNGMSIPVDSIQEGKEILAEMRGEEDSWEGLPEIGLEKGRGR